MIKLSPDERLLIESWINHYKVVGPGVIWLKPWQKERARLYVGPNVESIQCGQVRTMEDVPVDVLIKIFYRVNPELFTSGLLARVPILNGKGWPSIIQWRTEALLRRLVAKYSWRKLKNETVQEQLEQQLSNTLIGYLKGLGLEVLAAAIVKVELNSRLQQTITRAERAAIEAEGRAIVLKKYFEIFGRSLPEVMPYIKDWELLNLLHKKDSVQALLMPSGLSSGFISFAPIQVRQQIGPPWI